MKLRLSIEGRLLIIATLAISVALVTVYYCLQWLSDEIFLALAFAFLLSLSVTAVLIHLLCKPLRLRISGLRDGMLNLIDNDFSINIVKTGNDELTEVISFYNQVTEKLRVERQHLYQRELLLDTVIQNSSLCLVLTDDSDRIIYSNHHARQLFHQGKPIQGLYFNIVLESAPETLKEVIAQGRDGLFTIDQGDEENSYHLSLGRFVLNTQRHNLYLIKQMTRELNRQEVTTWKKVIRIISHELNNSLAPISSMAHSGSLLLKKNKTEGLAEVFASISERSEHLNFFINSYARLAKLPLPMKTEVDWRSFIPKLNVSTKFTIIGELPSSKAYFDSIQFEQVLTNLLKNAAESGSPEGDITLQITHYSTHTLIEIADKGKGMSKQVMENALLPFYTTKSTGSGVGLPLCREIIEAHDGEMSLANRKEGGLLLRVTIPMKG